jgi:uncharacterized protein (DUF1015 family)
VSNIYPFRALRPKHELSAEVAAPPYDVVSVAEARAIAEGNPNCFLRVGRAELELEDGVDPYSEKVYALGAANLAKLVERGVLYREEKPVFGVYRQQMGDHVQTGLVALASVDDYDSGVILKHELTRPQKENDRVRVIETHQSQSGPVFLTYRANDDLGAWFERATAGAPDADFTADDGIRHTVWTVRDAQMIEQVVGKFEAIPRLYIADGHHRSAAASRVRSKRRESLGEDAPENGFLTVIFPHDQMKILAYNRVVRDLNGLTPTAFLERLAGSFSIADTTEPGESPRGAFDVYVEGTWRRATAKPGIIPDDPVGRLDVSVLADRVLGPVLGVGDPRTDSRIGFVGGIRGASELESKVDSGDWAVAFALRPTTIEDLLGVADAGEIMPPKSTWFEPKLRDGLFVHMLGDPGKGGR